MTCRAKFIAKIKPHHLKTCATLAIQCLGLCLKNCCGSDQWILSVAISHQTSATCLDCSASVRGMPQVSDSS